MDMQPKESIEGPEENASHPCPKSLAHTHTHRGTNALLRVWYFFLCFSEFSCAAPLEKQVLATFGIMFFLLWGVRA